jgi:hypothetical protein
LCARLFGGDPIQWAAPVAGFSFKSGDRDIRSSKQQKSLPRINADSRRSGKGKNFSPQITQKGAEKKI